MLEAKRKTLAEEVIEGILEMIMSSAVRANEAIPTEEQLTKMFKVSRTAVRDATRTLIAHGVLETRRGVGTFVRDPAPGPFRSPSPMPWLETSTVLLELLEFRMIIEPELASLAAMRATPEDLVELQRCVSGLENGITGGIKPTEDLGFHLALAKATHNSSLLDIAAMISRFYENDPYLPTASDVKEHDAILRAIHDKNPALAAQKMRAHMNALKILYSLRNAS